MRISPSFLVSVSCLAAAVTVIDRVAVVVGKIVITESEVLQEVRFAAFLNGQPLDLGPQARREAGERLVDQQLIRNEIQIGHYPEPTAAQSDAALRKFRQEQYPNAADYQAALQKYGITEEQLKQHLIWQLQAIHFTDLRFRPGLISSPLAPPAAKSRAPAPRPPNANRSVTPDAAEPSDGGVKSASTAQTESDTAEESVDHQMDAWLKEARSQVRIQFKKEAFQ